MNLQGTAESLARNGLSGLILIDKPEGINSHSIVSFVRKALGTKRVGHLGTLDPFASGLLPILVGGFTRMSDALMEGKKAYLFTIALGAETDTLDCVGQVIARADVPTLHDSGQIEAALELFRGKIRQIPPKYSALKHKGRPLYEYMRTQGKLDFDIEDKAREVEISELTLDAWAPNELSLRSLCSKGTYVRSLCRDIAQALGTLGHCARLRRTRVGRFVAEDSLKLEISDLKNPSAWTKTLQEKLILPQAVFPELPSVTIPAAEEKICQRLESGNPVEISQEQWAAWIKHTVKIEKGGVTPQNIETTGNTPGFIATSRAFFFADLKKQRGAPYPYRLVPQKLLAQLS